MLWQCLRYIPLFFCAGGSTLIKKNFLIYKEIQSGAVAKSYMRKGFLIYEKMRKYFLIYEEAVRHIWLCSCSILNFLIYEENLVFFFISVGREVADFLRKVMQQWASKEYKVYNKKESCFVVVIIYSIWGGWREGGGGWHLTQSLTLFRTIAFKENGVKTTEIRSLFHTCGLWCM